MSNLPADELAQKDFLICMGIWLTLEIVSFILFPMFRLIQPPGERMQTWFLISLPLGVGGALLVALSSRYMAISNERDPGPGKSARIWLGQFMGGVGLVGLAFPLMMVVLEFFARMIAGDFQGT